MWAVTTSNEEGVHRVVTFADRAIAEREVAREQARRITQYGWWQDFKPKTIAALRRSAMNKCWTDFAETVNAHVNLNDLDVQLLEVDEVDAGAKVPLGLPPVPQTARMRNRWRRALRYAIQQMQEIGQDVFVRDLRGLRRTLPGRGVVWQDGATYALRDALMLAANMGGDVPLWNRGGQGYEAIRSLKLVTSGDL